MAQFSLATLYQQGHGVPQDSQQAYVWSSLAVAAGCNRAEAEALRDSMARAMSPAQLVEAQQEAASFYERQAVS